MKPILNLDALTYTEFNDHGFCERTAGISDRIGAKKLGYALTIVEPGQKSCPFHNHHHEEEMFFVLEGEGTLRFGERTYPLRAGDFIACPPGGREVAHQILNTGTVTMRYLCLGTKEEVEICEYPDSNKVGVFAGEPGKRRLRHLFKADRAVDYFLDEK